MAVAARRAVALIFLLIAAMAVNTAQAARAGPERSLLALPDLVALGKGKLNAGKEQITALVSSLTKGKGAAAPAPEVKSSGGKGKGAITISIGKGKGH